ncbi:hypothetical protein HMPREF9442_02676 [Paraprevotella xylaniphila YIT 11841]|uniref:Uncharacterized protein n=1 Tax=Paraprevotella xylaniphila YIT 11841 TaxID=762982 RepID=F3QWU4_9BACT|nr:hypothetical protein HMPREF9442_02676 [Paraprevotella xylaniphila YIT 11841]
MAKQVGADPPLQMDIHGKFSKICFILQDTLQSSGIQKVPVNDMLIRPSAFFQR